MATNVFVQNHTGHEFTIGRTSMRVPARFPLPSTSFEWNTRLIPPMRRTKLLEFDRAANVRNGEDYEFRSPLQLGGVAVELRQRMRGTLLHSKLWCSLGADPWFDDEAWHTRLWGTPRGPVEIVYRSYGTGGDNDIEYILNPAYPSNPSHDAFNVLAYNVYMRPTALFKNGQESRARLIPERIRDYDALVLSEVFDDRIRAMLLAELGDAYPHHTLVAGADGAFHQDGGVMIASKWPILSKDRLEFRVQNLRDFDPDLMCFGDDCRAEKGVVYASIGKQERIYHVFGTHLQAGDGGVEAAVRGRQVLVIQSWITAKRIPGADLVIVAGDLNVDRGSSEHASMLAVLRCDSPPVTGHPYTVDPAVNPLSNSARQAFLDYVLFSRRHAQPMSALLEVRPIRAARGWGIHDDKWELSDHFPVYGQFRFGRPAFSISPALLQFGDVHAGRLETHPVGLTIRSVGSGPVTVRGVAVRGADAQAFRVVAATALPTSLPPGQTVPLSVTFSGLGEGRRTADAVVTADGVLGEPVVASAVLVADVVRPDMAVLPTSINFGPVALLAESVRNVLVTNNGSATLHYRVEPPGTTAFKWAADTVLRQSLSPGGAHVVAVRFRPTTLGAHAATLSVIGDGETVHVSLSGQAVPPQLSTGTGPLVPRR